MDDQRPCTNKSDSLVGFGRQFPLAQSRYYLDDFGAMASFTCATVLYATFAFYNCHDGSQGVIYSLVYSNKITVIIIKFFLF